LPAAWHSSTLLCRVLTSKLLVLNQLQDIASLSVQAHEQRTHRGLEDSVAIANARSELLAAQQQVIAANGTLTQYRETLRALMGADAP
jgi:outer membrane protein, multidrug efflux system